MTNYTKGRSYEYKIAKKLRAEGWNVARSAGSHGDFDLIAIKPKVVWTYDLGGTPYEMNRGNIRLIQLKSGKSKLRMVKDVLKTDIKKYEGLYSVSVEVV